jgi:hypothetical protein
MSATLPLQLMPTPRGHNSHGSMKHSVRLTSQTPGPMLHYSDHAAWNRSWRDRPVRTWQIQPTRKMRKPVYTPVWLLRMTVDSAYAMLFMAIWKRKKRKKRMP